MCARRTAVERLWVRKSAKDEDVKNGEDGDSTAHIVDVGRRGYIEANSPLHLCAHSFIPGQIYQRTPSSSVYRLLCPSLSMTSFVSTCLCSTFMSLRHCARTG